MQAQLSHIMYQILSENIGEEVSCISIEQGQLIEYRGRLNQVIPFNGVQIDDDFVPFENDKSVKIGGNAIREIVHLSQARTLYFNQDTLGYAQGERDEMNISKVK